MPIYDEISQWGFNDGVVSVMKEGRAGAVDKKGDVVIPFEYDSDSIFRDGFSFVGRHNKYAMFNKQGHHISEFIHDRPGMFLNNRCVVCRNGKEGVIDEEGREIVVPQYRQIDSFYEYSYALVFKDSSDTNVIRNVVLINRDGKEIIPAIYDNIRLNNRTPETVVAILNDEESVFDLSQHILRKPKMLIKTIPKSV